MSELIISRRGFLLSAAVVGGGLALSGCMPGGEGGDAKPELLSSELSVWLEITNHDDIIIRVPTPEIGNGAMTQIAMNLA